MCACEGGTSHFESDPDPATGVVASPGQQPVATPTRSMNRGMWVWNSDTVIAAGDAQNALQTSAAQAQITDIYLYMQPTQYVAQQADLRAYISRATAAGMRVWALDGARTYFDDAGGPQALYTGIANLVAYNQQAQAIEQFYGFQADDEPQDSGAYKTFHDGVADSSLSSAAGSGVWQDTQTQDREMLMRDWLTIHAQAQATLHAAGLRFGVAMPSWLDDYYGEEVGVNYPDASTPRQGVMKCMMHIADDYVVMSYNTDPNTAAGLTLGPVQYASGFATGSQPRVHGAVETSPGQGEGVSYADTPGKDSRASVMADMNTITSTLSPYSAFDGVSIEQWSAWDTLKL